MIPTESWWIYLPAMITFAIWYAVVLLIRAKRRP